MLDRRALPKREKVACILSLLVHLFLLLVFIFIVRSINIDDLLISAFIAYFAVHLHHMTGMVLRPLLVLNELDVVGVELLGESVLNYAPHVLEFTLQRLQLGVARSDRLL